MDDDEDPTPPPCPHCKHPLYEMLFKGEVKGVESVSLGWHVEDHDDIGWQGDDDWTEDTEGTGNAWLECGRCNGELSLDGDPEWVTYDVAAMKALGAPDETIMEASL